MKRSASTMNACADQPCVRVLLDLRIPATRSLATRGAYAPILHALSGFDLSLSYQSGLDRSLYWWAAGFEPAPLRL
jgi:hypothetical protein